MPTSPTCTGAIILGYFYNEIDWVTIQNTSLDQTFQSIHLFLFQVQRCDRSHRVRRQVHVTGRTSSHDRYMWQVYHFRRRVHVTGLSFQRTGTCDRLHHFRWEVRDRFTISGRPTYDGFTTSEDRYIWQVTPFQMTTTCDSLYHFS